MWYGLDKKKSIPPKYSAAIARTLALLPAHISRGCARDKPVLGVFDKASADDQLLAVGWHELDRPSEISFILAHYSKAGFRPIGKKEEYRKPIDFAPIISGEIALRFLDPQSRSLLTSDEFFLSPKPKPTINRLDHPEPEPPRKPTEAPSGPRDATGIGLYLADQLDEALNALRKHPLVVGGREESAAHPCPIERVIYPGKDKEVKGQIQNNKGHIGILEI